MTMRIPYIVIAIFLLCGCGQFNEADSVQELDEPNSSKQLLDYGSSVSSILFLTDGQQFSDRGFTNERSSWPSCFSKFDSLYIYIPPNKFQVSALCIGFDSILAVQGKKPDFVINDLRRSCIVKMNPEFFQKYDTIIGAFKCWDSLKNIYEYFPFVTAIR